MRANQQAIPLNPSRPNTGDLYDNIETRPDTSEAQKEIGRNAYIELLESQARWAGGAILGCNFPKDFKEQGGTTLLNRQIKSAHELAVMAQILRDPRFETLRIFYTRKNRIIHHTAISSRLPGSVYLEKINGTDNHLGDWVINTRFKVQADGYWLLHNHPSGRAAASRLDERFTAQLASLVPGFKGHVIINTSQYSVINRKLEVSFVDWMGGQAGGYQNDAYKQHDYLLENIAMPDDLARIGMALKHKDRYFNLIGTNATGAVQSISELPVSVLKRSSKILLARLQKFTRNAGVSSMFAITPDKHLNHPVLLKACETGILRDVIGVDTNNNNDYRSLRTESVIATDSSREISAMYRKSRALITEDNSLNDLKTKTTKTNMTIQRSRRGCGR
ncbi:RadC-like JAB domain-containing protein [Nitrosomonas marina]|uniref:RadC-like JAB domain-containing protein n=1 Tax=Nitrosomonas marina TaxID=917 RepID=A0A1I0FI35_9PROT|nr:JAB domain-containing protein [Nitrosomonas marina]SET57902.1 RadC-like JAB domain-containing protein [Nitrosomonas marina]